MLSGATLLSSLDETQRIVDEEGIIILALSVGCQEFEKRGYRAICGDAEQGHYMHLKTRHGGPLYVP